MEEEEVRLDPEAEEVEETVGLAIEETPGQAGDPQAQEDPADLAVLETLIAENLIQTSSRTPAHV